MPKGGPGIRKGARAAERKEALELERAILQNIKTIMFHPRTPKDLKEKVEPNLAFARSGVIARRRGGRHSRFAVPHSKQHTHVPTRTTLETFFP